MNGFYFGLLVFPLSVAALGIAVGTVMWGLNQARKWSEQSTADLNHLVQLPQVHELSPGNRITTVANMNKRDILVKLVATSRRAKLVQFGSNTGLIIVGGGNGGFTPEEEAIFQKAFNTAVQELGEAHSARKQGLEDQDGQNVETEDSEAAEAPEKAAEAS